MKIWQNALLQFSLTFLQGANAFTSIVPDKYKPLVMLALAAAQSALSYIAHQYNPDGTKAAQ